MMGNHILLMGPNNYQREGMLRLILTLPINRPLFLPLNSHAKKFWLKIPLNLFKVLL